MQKGPHFSQKNHRIFSKRTAKDRIFVAPTIGIQITTLHEASDWGITTEVAESLGMRRELEIGAASMKELHRRGVKVLPGGA